jgi:hypothetical protein
MLSSGLRRIAGLRFLAELFSGIFIEKHDAGRQPLSNPFRLSLSKTEVEIVRVEELSLFRAEPTFE